MRLFQYTYPSFRTPGFSVGRFQRSPWPGLDSEINRLFETALGDFNAPPAATHFPVDLYQDKQNTYVRAELPGVNREDINVEVVDGFLKISATRKTPAIDCKPEQSLAVSRSVNVADAVQADKVGAAYENGVLTVTLPKREEAKPKKITVAVK
ncbi:MAG: Hsp20/alpha crystallin family protein [Opitutus sp.]|nr:Hsp20/alpha crystallin family protein [Opitutus sp.]